MTTTANPFLTDFDLYLLGEGNHHRIYEKLGAHVIAQDDRLGTNFAVWAPNARAVSVIGDFNGWQPQQASACTPRLLRASGRGSFLTSTPVRFTSMPITSQFGDFYTEKADPCGFAAEIRPQTASKVWDLAGYNWGDSYWLSAAAWPPCPRSSHFDLRGSPRLLAAGSRGRQPLAHLPRTGHASGRLCPANGLHPRRTDAD